MEKGYTRHSITDTNEQSIIVELGKISIINSLKFLLWDRDHRSYSYFVDVCVDQSCWERVIDHSNYLCRSWQWLYFSKRAVRFIRLTGTHNTVNKVFHVVALEAVYSSTIPNIVDGLVAPVENVAMVEKSAIVLQGVSRSRNALLNSDISKLNYGNSDISNLIWVQFKYQLLSDWDCGYTCHQLGSGEILIQLGQPYLIGSLRILLWDCDERSYSFYIETSTNEKDWEIVVDKRNDQVQSWNSYTFEPRPIIFIRIIGTYNTANEVGTNGFEMFFTI